MSCQERILTMHKSTRRLTVLTAVVLPIFTLNNSRIGGGR